MYKEIYLMYKFEGKQTRTCMVGLIAIRDPGNFPYLFHDPSPWLPSSRASHYFKMAAEDPAISYTFQTTDRRTAGGQKYSLPSGVNSL